MCGIVGYIGHREAYPIVIKGLKRLEYRGYDSAGVMVYDGALKLCKTKGKVVDLEELALKEITTNGTIGIGHTRWATHGVPNDVNSHPHLSNSGELAIVHNGIIENYAPLKEELMKRGYVFHSDTDTEVYSIKGEASEAIKYSPSPTPIARGLPKRAATISSGFFISKTAIAYAPTT